MEQDFSKIPILTDTYGQGAYPVTFLSWYVNAKENYVKKSNFKIFQMSTSMADIYERVQKEKENKKGKKYIKDKGRGEGASSR